MGWIGRRRSAAPRSRGQSLVEFALVLPLFLLLFMAVMDFGTAVFTYNSLTNAAREGVRLAVVNQDSASVIQRAKNQVSTIGVRMKRSGYRSRTTARPTCRPPARRPPWAASPS